MILSLQKYFLYFLNNLLTLPVKQVLHSMLSPMLSEIESLNILIAEDDQDIVRMYEKILENKTNHITVTTHGEECLRIYNEKFKEITATGSYDQPFDILILDYKMPNIDGFEVAKRIISINPRQRIILASAYGKDIFEDAAEYFNLPIDILQKPFSRIQLIELVEKKRTLPKALA